MTSKRFGNVQRKLQSEFLTSAAWVLRRPESLRLHVLANWPLQTRWCSLHLGGFQSCLLFFLPWKSVAQQHFVLVVSFWYSVSALHSSGASGYSIELSGYHKLESDLIARHNRLPIRLDRVLELKLFLWYVRDITNKNIICSPSQVVRWHGIQIELFLEWFSF